MNAEETLRVIIKTKAGTGYVQAFLSIEAEAAAAGAPKADIAASDARNTDRLIDDSLK